jgi:hypothetical protein
LLLIFSVFSSYFCENQRNDNGSNEQIPMAECKTEELKLSTRFASTNNIEHEDITSEVPTRNNCLLINADTCKHISLPETGNL